MEFNTYRLSRGMPPAKIKLSIILLCLISSLTYADCIKELNYRLLEERSFAIEAGTDITQLSELDLLRGKPNVKFSDVHLCIDEFGFISKTSIFTYSANTYYPNRIYQTIETAAGLDAFDDQGNLIFSVPNEPAEISDIPGFGKAMTQNEISTFGVSMDFSGLVSSFQAHFTQNGGNHWTVGTKDYFSTSDQDVIIASQDQYMLSSTYDRDGNLQGMFLQTSIERNGYHIPQYEISYDYDALSTGDILQTSIKDTYLNYTVVENGQTIMQYAQSQHPYMEGFSKGVSDINQTQFGAFTVPKRLTPSIEIFPNPANDFINVSFNNELKDTNGAWTIRSSSGAIVFSGDKNIGDTQLSISLPNLSPGLYLFQMNQSKNTLSRKFIIAR